MDFLSKSITQIGLLVYMYVGSRSDRLAPGGKVGQNASQGQSYILDISIIQTLKDPDIFVARQQGVGHLCC